MSNPMFRNSLYEKAYAISERPMTVSGTLNKLMLLSLIMLVSAGAVFYQFSLGRLDYVNLLMHTGLFVGVAVTFVMIFKQDCANFLAPIYAFAQGAFLSGISCYFEKMYEGIVTQAISITILVVLSMAVLYKTNIIRATDKFRRVIFTATLAIGIFYLISLVFMLFNVPVPYFFSSSPVAIAVNAVIAGIAALNLITDFDFVERGVNSQLPAFFEWYAAYGLLVTILWLYIEILRLLARSRR